MMNQKFSRRDVLSATAVLALPVLGLACSKKELQCSDTAGLSADEAATRKTLAYVDRASDPAKPCDKCMLYKPAAPEACGGCSVVKGPVHPAGSCSAWAKKPA
jgi:hypothetical protein